MIINYPKMLIRIPLDVKQFLRDESINNCCSQNAEVVRAIRAAMNLKGSTGGNLAGATPVYQINNTANGGGAFITKQQDCLND